MYVCYVCLCFIFVLDADSFNYLGLWNIFASNIMYNLNKKQIFF